MSNDAKPYSVTVSPWRDGTTVTLDVGPHNLLWHNYNAKDHGAGYAAKVAEEAAEGLRRVLNALVDRVRAEVVPALDAARAEAKAATREAAGARAALGEEQRHADALAKALVAVRAWYRWCSAPPELTDEDRAIVASFRRLPIHPVEMVRDVIDPALAAHARRSVSATTPDEPYLIRNLVGGEMALWWKPERAGYTANVDKAGRYTREEAEAQARARNTDEAWPLSKALALASRYVPNETITAASTPPVVQGETREQAIENKGDSNG